MRNVEGHRSPLPKLTAKNQQKKPELLQTDKLPATSPSSPSPSSWTPPHRRSSAGGASGNAASQRATQTQHHHSPLCVCASRCPLPSYQAAALRLPVVAGSPKRPMVPAVVPACPRPVCLSVGCSPVVSVCQSCSPDHIRQRIRHFSASDLRSADKNLAWF